MYVNILQSGQKDNAAAVGGRMEINMKNQRHKRKESFSILLLSNTGGVSRQFHISLFLVRTAIFLILLICAAVAVLAYLVSMGQKDLSAMRRQLEAQGQRVEQLELEKKTLEKEKKALASEKETLQQPAQAAAEEKEPEKKPEEDSAYPGLYPSSGASIIESTFSEEQPYLSIRADTADNIIAVGDGTVVSVGSDDVYPHIIEVEHERGYRTRYLCRQQAELHAEEGAHVQAGNILLTITADDTKLDYQVIFEGEPIDPLTVIQAQG